MTSFRRLPPPELRRVIWGLSCECAAAAYLRSNPAAPEEDVVTFAERNWRTYTDKALDILALLEAANEAAAHPNN